MTTPTQSPPLKDCPLPDRIYAGSNTHPHNTPTNGHWLSSNASGLVEYTRADAPQIAEVTAEEFIQAAIDNAPEPLKRLGQYLADLLDAEDWNTVEPMLLAVATQPKPQPEKE